MGEIIIMFFVGIVIGIYTSSQIKCHIKNNIEKNLKEYDEKEKIKQ